MNSSRFHVSVLSVCVLAVSGGAATVTRADDAPEPSPFALTDWLDAEYAKIWEEAGVDVERCDDATFLRRIHLDLQGRIPSVMATREFLASDDENKRQQAVQSLLVDESESGRNDELAAEHLARIWRRMMIPSGSQNANMAPAFEPWLRKQFRDNVPYDEFARRLITAEGEDDQDAAAFYAAVGGQPEHYAGAFSRVFLGTQIGCAQCHDHPFADWKQNDFWGMAAFFSGTTTANATPFSGGQLSERRSTSIAFEGKEYTVAFLGGGPAEVPASKLPREVLAEWMTGHDNLDFAATTVNRIWQHLCGRGLYADVDNLDLAGPDARGQILDALAQKFIDSGYDLRWLITGICNSRVYQCPTMRAGDEDSALELGTRPLKSLTSEQIFDSLEQALGLSVTRSDSESPRHNGTRAQMVNRLDESLANTPEDYGAGIPQVLMLINGRLTADATSLDRSRTLRAVVEAPFMDESMRVETLYLATFTRMPTDRERDFMLKHIERQTAAGKANGAYAEIFWALMNSPEFVLCR